MGVLPLIRLKRPGRVSPERLRMFAFCRRRGTYSSPRILPSRTELERTTDIFFADSEMEDHGYPEVDTEACMTENDQFVGTTAKFDDDGKIVSLRSDLRPKE